MSLINLRYRTRKNYGYEIVKYRTHGELVLKFEKPLDDIIHSGDYYFMIRNNKVFVEDESFKYQLRLPFRIEIKTIQSLERKIIILDRKGNIFCYDKGKLTKIKLLNMKIPKFENIFHYYNKIYCISKNKRLYVLTNNLLYMNKIKINYQTNLINKYLYPVYYLTEKEIEDTYLFTDDRKDYLKDKLGYFTDIYIHHDYNGPNSDNIYFYNKFTGAFAKGTNFDNIIENTNINLNEIKIFNKSKIVEIYESFVNYKFTLLESGKLHFYEYNYDKFFELEYHLDCLDALDNNILTDTQLMIYENDVPKYSIDVEDYGKGKILPDDLILFEKKVKEIRY